MLSEVRAVLFDLDGTLVDSVPDLATAMDATLVELGLAAAGEARVRQWVGRGSPQLMRDALTAQTGTEPPAELLDRALARFFEHYGARLSAASVLYPGVREGLLRLRRRGLDLAVVTNKPARFIAPLLEALGLAEDFAVVVGGDTLVERKPHPAPLLHAIGQLGRSPADSLMVGDSRTDVAAARRAGMAVICVPYGYNHGEDIRQAAPDAVVADLNELANLLEQAA